MRSKVTGLLSIQEGNCVCVCGMGTIFMECVSKIQRFEFLTCSWLFGEQLYIMYKAKFIMYNNNVGVFCPIKSTWKEECSLFKN